MYKLAVFIPESHLDVVKQALFAAGAGRIGNYDCCSWQVRGEGQFRPLPGSAPAIGTAPVDGAPGPLETVIEYRIEMVCEDALMQAVIEALRSAHPYETPAFDVWRLEEF